MKAVRELRHYQSGEVGYEIEALLRRLDNAGQFDREEQHTQRRRLAESLRNYRDAYMNLIDTRQAAL